MDEILSGYEIVCPIDATELARLYHARRRVDGAEVVLRHIVPPVGAGAIDAVLAEARSGVEAAGDDVASPDAERGAGGRTVLVEVAGPGENLRRRLELGPFKVGRALEIGRRAADVLGRLHERGISHGLIRPANLWLRADGGVRLLAVGLHRLLEEVPAGDLSPISAAYLAPECLRGEAPTPASDVWSLAAVLFEMITGNRAFAGTTSSEVRRAVVSGSRPEVRGVRTGIGPELEEFLAAALDGDPALRPTTMDAVAGALGEMEKLLTAATDVEPDAPTVGGTVTNPDRAAPKQFRAPVSPGDTVGGFQVLEQLGRGGMGMVYRARDRRLGRHVALKFLPQGTAGEHPPERFIQEAKAASALDHPNICTIYGVDETPSGDSFIAMAVYEGPSLMELLESGSLPLTEALRIAIHICSGLVAAHERGIVHCDIKPGNVVLADDGTAKIVDFGVSRMAHLTYIDGAGFVGTAGYAAPEQVWRREIDRRADLWAVGVVLYEMLAGERPFSGHGMKALMSTVEEVPATLADRVPALPPRLETIVRRCLERDPEDRYQSAAELLSDLEAVMVEVSTRDARRRRRRWAIAGVLAAALTVAATVSWVVPRLAPRVGEDTGRRVALVGVVAGDPAAGGGWLRGSLEELLRFELSGLDDFRVIGVSRQRASALEQNADLAAVLDPGSLSAIALEEDAEFAVVGAYRLVGPPDGRELSLEVRAQPARGQEAAAVGEAGGDPTEVVAVVAAAVAQLGSRLGVAPSVVPDADWRPFATVESEALHRNAVARLRVLDSRAARPLLERALELEPGNPVLEMTLADALADLGRDSDAAALAAGAVEHAAGAPRSLRLLAHARSLESERRSGRASAAYRALWEIGQGCALPGEAPADGVVRLANSLVRASRAEEALAIVGEQPDPAAADPRLDLVRAEAFHWLGRHDPQLAAARRAVGAARRDGLDLVLARALRLLASSHWRLGRIGDGLAALTEARTLYQRHEHVKGEADIDAMTGVLLYEKGELWQAKASYDRAARRYGALGNRRAQARTLTNKALVLEQQGDLDATIDVTREAVELFRESGDSVAEQISLVNLTSALRARGRLEEASRTIAAALDLMQQVARFEAWTLLHASDVEVALGELVEAASLLARAAEVQEGDGDLGGRALTDARMAHLLRLQGEAAEACRLFERAMPVLADRATPLDHASALRDYGEALRARGELVASGRVLERALEIQSSVTTRAGRSETQIALAATLRAAGRSDAAEALAREALADLELRGLVVAIADARGLLARLALDRGDPESAGSEVARARDTLEGVDSPLPRMELDLVALDIDIARRKPGVRESLQSLLAEATSRGYVELGLEVMLDLGLLEIASGAPAAGLARLEGVAADARLKGLDLIAGRAEVAVLEARSGGAS